jgi:hypothetical protein
MALLAAAGNFARVRCVALSALRDLAVNVMTGRTVEHGMLALIVPQLFSLQRMAVKTGIFSLKCYL